MDFLRYVESGFSVIPVRGKQPISTGWQKYSGRLPGLELAERWQETYENMNMGLVLGEASKVMAIDIDTDEISKHIPDSPVKKRGKKGETRFFKFNPKIAAMKDHSRHIEILSTGNQTVLPPSIHPETKKPYNWTGSHDLFTGDLPELTSIEWIKLLPVDTERSGGGAYTLGQGRNSKLSSMVCAAYTNSMGFFDEQVLVNDLVSYDDTNHMPPYFRDTTEPEAHRTNGDPYKAAMIFVLRHEKQLSKKKLGAPCFITTLPPEEKPKYKLLEPPKPTGLMLDIHNEILSKSYTPQPALALGAAVSLMSTMCSGRYVFNNTWPNTYNLLIAKTGFGKDAPLNIISRILSHKDMRSYNLYGLGSYVSAPATILSLPSQRVRLDIVDELGEFFRGVATGDAIKLGTAKEITKIWDESKGYYSGIYSIGRKAETGACHNPCINILATCQPETLINSTNKDMFDSGLIMRFIMHVASDVKPPANVGALSASIDVDNIVARIKEVFPEKNLFGESFQIENIDTAIGMRKLSPKVLTSGVGVLDTITQIFLDMYNKQGEEQMLYSRAMQQILKITIIKVISDGREEIIKNDLDWAMQYVESCLSSSRFILNQAQAESEVERTVIRMRSHFQKKKQMTAQDIANNFRKDPKLRNTALSELQAMGEVERKGNVYVYVGVCI